MKKLCIAVSILIACVSNTFAQHTMDDMPGMDHHMPKDTTEEKDAMAGMNMSDHTGHMNMSSALSLNLPMTRDGSGTSWAPDAAPMYMYMKHYGKWMFIAHGDVFIRYNKQDIGNTGSRGSDKIDAPDMLMLMGQRNVGVKGLFHFNVMLSTDAFVTGGSGYPLLFQTGESWQGKPLVDRQHPHDLFSELSVSYAYALSKKADVSLYIGYPGEPALGPVTFMHRVSGEFIPDAPISHHWADATHITFGVATVGIRYGKFKLEGSSFTGREPDENRYNFDKPLFDSWSGRLSFNPSPEWALQASHGFIKSPEALSPTEDINRTTASATYVHNFSPQKYIAATLLFGQNVIAHEDASNAILFEVIYKVKKLALYTRYEWVQKSGEELNLDPLMYGFSTFYNINAVTIGGGYDLFTLGPIIVACGAQVSLDHTPDALTGLYDSNPISGEVYLHLYPRSTH